MEHEAIANAFWSGNLFTAEGAFAREVVMCVHVPLSGISSHVHTPLIQAGTPSAAAGYSIASRSIVAIRPRGIGRLLNPPEFFVKTRSVLQLD